MELERLKKSVLSRYSSEEDVKVYAQRSAEGFRNWERLIVEKFMLPTKVLSIGCGGGRESFALESLGYDAHGLDISEEQIASANERKLACGSNAHFHVYDGSSIPFPDACFGSVTMWSQVLGNVPGSQQRHRLLRECLRVLVDHGILSISVHDLKRSMRRLRDSADEYRELEGGEPGDLLLATSSGIECYWHYFTQEELRHQCSEAGFTIALETTSDRLGQDWDNLDIVVCRKAITSRV